MPLLEKAASADFVVLPELANTGYNFKNRDELLAVAEEADNSHFLHFLEKACQKYSYHVVAGFAELEGVRIYNSAALVAPDGIVGLYRKVHLFDNEKVLFEPGNLGFPLFEVNGLRIGMLICFDWVFPEAWRIMALKGADLICHPCNLVLPKKAQRTVPGHAACNKVYIALANRTGNEDELYFTGNSLIVDPNGELLCEASPEDDEILWAKIEPEKARNKFLTRRNNWIADRRTDIYHNEGLV